MPPKGWRKYGDGTQLPKEAELVSIDDILFPRATINRLTKSILSPSDNTPGAAGGDNMGLTKDSLTAVQRSATVFVSHLSFHARQIARDSGRKVVNSQDILRALERADLAGFAPEIKQKLSTFESTVVAKKKAKGDAQDQSVDGNEEPASKKMRDNSSNEVLKVGDEGEETEEEDEELDEIQEEDDSMQVDNSRLDDATVSPVNGGVEEDEEGETVATNPIALLAQEEQELNGLEPEEPQKEQDDEAQQTDDE